jgi:hypothetical protein
MNSFSNFPTIFGDALTFCFSFAGGGKFGKAVTAYLKWQFKGDEASKKLFLDANSPLVADGWNITAKNWR